MGGFLLRAVGRMRAKARNKEQQKAEANKTARRLALIGRLACAHLQSSGQTLLVFQQIINLIKELDLIN